MSGIELMIHDEVLEMTNDISLETTFALLYDLGSSLCKMERPCIV